MRSIKSIFLLALLSLALNTYSAEKFEFDPQNHKVKLKADYIGFTDNSSNEIIGPELYADETDSRFFALVKNIVQNAKTNNAAVILFYEKVNSGTHGEYSKIIPEF